MTTAPTYGLIKDVIEVVEDLPPELFNLRATHRSCGLLDKRSAYGMLICDVHGLPLVPWTLDEPIGKLAVKKDKEISGEKSKAKKAAARKGTDPEGAAAAVLRRPVALNSEAADCRCYRISLDANRKDQEAIVSLCPDSPREDSYQPPYATCATHTACINIRATSSRALPTSGAGRFVRWYRWSWNSIMNLGYRRYPAAAAAHAWDPTKPPCVKASVINVIV